MDNGYYIGLDIGTNSVGWAVTDKEYNLCRHKKRDLWGIRLFESAETADTRRISRTTRRRLERRKWRIDLLQDLFSEEINRIDPTFFTRLNESRLHKEDKSVDSRFPLFIDKDFNDVDYYKNYPTVFHLRKELIESCKAHDVRLVYLALHNIIKYRGHFLIEGGFSEAVSFKPCFDMMVENLLAEMGIEITVSDPAAFEKILGSREISGSKKKRSLNSLIQASSADMEPAALKKKIEEISKLLAGNKADIVKLFGETLSDVETKSFTFRSSEYEEKVYPELEGEHPEFCYVLDSIKALHDWSILSGILHGESFISAAKVSLYDEHHENLRKLKAFMKKYCKSRQYKEFFDSAKKKAANYSNYIGYVKIRGKKTVAERCSEEDFYKNLKSIISVIEARPEDEAEKEYLMDHIDQKDLLPLQRSKDNAAVPRQVNEMELDRIISNASAYLPFLSEKDIDGITTAEKIKSIFNFRVPYYVGPLSDRHKNEGSNSWIVRKEEGYIYPWNLDRKVDLEASNEEFINRLTNKCSYLIGEDVLPKNSLVYSEYMVLNELNNLRIRGNALPVTVKQELFENLYKKKNRVKASDICKYLKRDDHELEISDLSGFNGDMKASYSSYLDLSRKIFDHEDLSRHEREIAEDMIRWVTIYGNDRTMLRKVISQKYGKELTRPQIDAACKFKYSGWGRLSGTLLTEIQGISSETGEVFNILKAMYDTQDNFMQLLSSKYSFSAKIAEFNADRTDIIDASDYGSVFKDVYVSPSVKRPIWQSIQIIKELIKVQGRAPEKIFIEMARENESDEKKNRMKSQRNSRKERLLELYRSCDDDTRNWTAEIEGRDEREFNSMKLFLYYTQMGRCMYTGEPIDLDQLMKGNSEWDRDHIYPQSKVKDDSIDNLVLVKKVENSKKSNGLLSDTIRRKMFGFWRMLLDRGFISKKKFDRLTRVNDFTDEELAGFISRQLVETRQATKAVADLLKEIYPDIEIVYVKAGLTSEFRARELSMLKSRLANDLHHAKDAYLNIVTGNVYYTRFTTDPYRWIKAHRDEDYSVNAVFSRDLKDRSGNTVWHGPDRDEERRIVKNEAGGYVGGSIDTVRSTMEKDRMYYTEYTYCDSGALFDATLQPKGSTGASIPLKKGMSIEEYGGYISPSTSYFAQIEFDDKKNVRTKNIVGVPIYVSELLKQDPDALVKYFETRGYKNVKVLRERIKKNSLLIVNGFPMRIRGENEVLNTFKGNMQLTCPPEIYEIIRNIEKSVEKNRIQIVEEKDGQKMVGLYDYMTKKLKKIYAGRPANMASRLEGGKKVFVSLSLVDERDLLYSMITMLRCDNDTTSDLTKIGGSKNSGNMAVNKNTIGKSEVILVNQSVTGIYENRIKL